MKISDVLATVDWHLFEITVETKPGYFESVRLDYLDSMNDNDSFEENRERLAAFKNPVVSGISFDERTHSFQIDCWYEDQPKNKRRKAA